MSKIDILTVRIVISIGLTILIALLWFSLKYKLREKIDKTSPRFGAKLDDLSQKFPKKNYFYIGTIIIIHFLIITFAITEKTVKPPVCSSHILYTEIDDIKNYLNDSQEKEIKIKNIKKYDENYLRIKFDEKWINNEDSTRKDDEEDLMEIEFKDKTNWKYYDNYYYYLKNIKDEEETVYTLIFTYKNEDETYDYKLKIHNEFYDCQEHFETVKENGIII